MCLGKKVKFITFIYLAKMWNFLYRSLCPIFQWHLVTFIFQIIFQNYIKFLFICTMFLISANILFHYDLITQCFIWSFQNNPSKVTSSVKLIHRNTIFQTIGITYKFVCRQMSVLNRKEIAFCSYINLQISPGIFLHSKSLFSVFYKRNKSTAFFFQCKKNLLFLLAPYQEFFKGVLIQFPFTHIIIKRLDPRIFIFENLKEISGPE